MLKSGSDKSFRDFLGSGSYAVKVGIVAILALVLILVGSPGSGAESKDATSEEERLAEICSLAEGVGECRVMVTYREVDGESEVYAVAVLCQGAESPNVRERITSLICSLYGIGAHRVEIVKIN